MQNKKADTINYLSIYLRHRPLFLSLIRAKEAAMFQKFLPLKRPALDVGCGDGNAGDSRKHGIPVTNYGLALSKLYHPESLRRVLEPWGVLKG